jgi:hypothetical protein
MAIAYSEQTKRSNLIERLSLFFKGESRDREKCQGTATLQPESEQANEALKFQVTREYTQFR